MRLSAYHVQVEIFFETGGYNNAFYSKARRNDILFGPALYANDEVAKQYWGGGGGWGRKKWN